MNNNKEKLYWLAGMIDGDGSILVEKDKRGYFIPQITIWNTDIVIMEECKTILSSLNINCNIQKMSVKPRKDGYLRKQAFRIRIKNSDDLERLCVSLDNLLVGKAEQLRMIKLSLEGKADKQTLYSILGSLNRRRVAA